EVDTTISVVFTLGSSPSDSTPAPDIDPQLKTDILHLLDVTHSVERAQSAGRTAFEPLRAQVTASMPATPGKRSYRPISKRSSPCFGDQSSPTTSFPSTQDISPTPM